MQNLFKYFLVTIFIVVSVFGISQFNIFEVDLNQISKASPQKIAAEQDASGMVYPLVEARKQLLEPLPWEEDAKFKGTILKHHTPIMMAKYHATLHDPLPGEMYNVGLAADRLAGTVVMPGEIFSQNRKLGPYTSAKGYQEGPMYKGTAVVKSTGGGVCKIASLLYNVATLSNLRIIERHNHSMTVPYVPPGQDATVYYGVKDLRFLNNTSGPIVIWADTVGNTLYMAIYGQNKPPKVTWHHETLKHIKYWSIYRTNFNLPKGTEKVVVPGQDGYLVRSWLTIEYEDGKIEKKNLGKNWYDALPQVIERGPK
ncbi:VanW family protein [Zhaonella formicivorans]|uniref:VanW family protein n=1 Tax=Zhaonella formicivorans TaxID=2528593 RepID=UPI0010E87350|nr:VanW family protein [Zhaonella formicivorans]